MSKNSEKERKSPRHGGNLGAFAGLKISRLLSGSGGHSDPKITKRISNNDIDEESLKIAIFTFNVEGRSYSCHCESSNIFSKVKRKIVGSGDLNSNFVSKYIQRIREHSNGELPDIIFVNLQEAGVGITMSGSKASKLAHSFLDAIQRYDSEYVLIDDTVHGINSGGLVGISTAIIVNRGMTTQVNFYQYRPILGKSRLTVGQGQHLGKGAVMVDMFVKKNSENYRLNVINTHLPFSGKEPDQGKKFRDMTIVETLKYYEEVLELDSDYVKFIVGDLNYRIDFGDDVEMQEEYINELMRNPTPDKHTMSQYHRYDQLIQVMDEILVDYREGVDGEGPLFPPSCKLEKASTGVDSRGYEIEKGGHKRVPSWCDRILYFGNVDCTYYDSFDYGTTKKSDHRPVVGLYTIHPMQAETPSREEIELYNPIHAHRSSSVNGVIEQHRSSFSLLSPKKVSIQQSQPFVGSLVPSEDPEHGKRVKGIKRSSQYLAPIPQPSPDTYSLPDIISRRDSGLLDLEDAFFD